MTDDSPETQNPYDAPPQIAPEPNAAEESGDLTTVDWLLCIFCSGIACIIGLVRLIQGKPSAGKMIGFSILFSFIWGAVRAILTAMIAANQ